MQTNFYLVLLTLFGLIAISTPTAAQTYQPSNRAPVADNTLGTQVSGFDITGGLNKGQTLFHSFTDFSVPTNGQANFIRPTGNRDIITRVTGGLFSDINGIVNTNGANFLLINPNGVVFGPNAQLNNIGRSFVTSTASGLDLLDGSGRTINFGTNSAGDGPLIAIDPNIAFNPSKLIMGGNNSGGSGIVNYGTLQTTNQGQYIGLIGGNITINGGKVIAPGGRVDLGGLNSAGTMAIDSQGLIFGGNNLVRSDILLSNGAQVGVRAKETLGQIDPFFANASSPGSSINIAANNVRLINDVYDAKAPQSSFDAGLAADSGTKTAAGGDINIDASGDVVLDKGSFIKNTMLANSGGKIGNINIKAGSLRLTDRSAVRASTVGLGNAGNINITAGDISLLDTSDIQAGVVGGGTGKGGDININTTGNISLVTINPTLGQSYLLTSTNGKGESGKIKIVSQGDLLLSRGGIFATVEKTGDGKSNGIDINARNISLSNRSEITADNFGRGNAGDIKIEAKGNISISGTEDRSQLQGNITTRLSKISSQTDGEGNTGKITLTADGDLSISNRGDILAGIKPQGKGNSNGISINAKNINLSNYSNISAGNSGQGNSGNINIKSKGNFTVSGTDNPVLLTGVNNDIIPLSIISTQTNGVGNAGKISIEMNGNDLSISNRSAIFAGIGKAGRGNSQGIEIIKARNVKINSFSGILARNNGAGNGGDVKIETTGDLTISGNDTNFAPSKDNRDAGSVIDASTNGQGDTGKITIDTTGNLSLINSGGIFALVGKTGEGNSNGIEIKAGNLELSNFSYIETINDGGKGNAGNIKIEAKNKIKIQDSKEIVSQDPTRDSSRISSTSRGNGKANDISISANQIQLNGGKIFTQGNTVDGGDIVITLDELLLLSNNGGISTNSDSTGKNSSGGNIKINSPLIIAAPGNNDITANANGGTGGNITISSQGLFGIQPRAQGQASPFTSDITASSNLGQNGNVNITTPGTDPGKDKGELSDAPNDASKQISQACAASQRDSKLYVTGRGGLPPNASEPLESEALWQDARAQKVQPATTAQPPERLAPPAIGLAFQPDGTVRSISAQTAPVVSGETKFGCPDK
jgi:filamentous hemagglutinin family protein